MFCYFNRLLFINTKLQSTRAVGAIMYRGTVLYLYATCIYDDGYIICERIYDVTAVTKIGSLIPYFQWKFHYKACNTK